MPPQNNQIQPMPSDPKPGSGKAKAVALIGAAALAISAPLIAKWEGKENDPYRDIVKVWTVCYGDTRNVVPGQRQTDAQCTDRLYAQIADHAMPIVKCVPGLLQPERKQQLAASVSLAYNIGTGGFCKSTVARRFNAKNWRGGCDAFLMWNKAGGRVVRGLDNRRREERQICLTGL